MLTASRTGCTRLAAVSGSPFIANWMSTSCRLGETAGARMSCTRPVAWTPVMTARTAEEKPAAPAVAVALCTSTSSCAGCATPASVSSHCARPDSPEPYSACVMVTWPTALPISIATTTSSSQPVMAISGAVRSSCPARPPDWTCVPWLGPPSRERQEPCSSRRRSHSHWHLTAIRSVLDYPHSFRACPMPGRGRTSPAAAPKVPRLGRTRARYASRRYGGHPLALTVRPRLTGALTCWPPSACSPPPISSGGEHVTADAAGLTAVAGVRVAGNVPCVHRPGPQRRHGRHRR